MPIHLFPPVSMASYSFIKLSELGRRGVNEHVIVVKRQQPGHPRM